MLEDEDDLQRVVELSSKNSIKRKSFLDKIRNFSFGCTKADEDVFAPGMEESGLESISNLQEEQVDEIDVVKKEGNTIYYINYGLFYVYNVNGSKVSIEFEENHCVFKYDRFRDVCDEGIYVTDDMVCVIVCYSWFEDNASGGKVNHLMYGTKVICYDKKTMHVEKSVEFEGKYINSRVYNNYLYLITSEYVDYEKPSFNEDEEEKEIEYNEVSYMMYSENSAYTYVTSICLEDFSMEVSVQLGSVNYDVIYMSEKYLYLVSRKYNAKINKEISSVYAYTLENGHCAFFGTTYFEGVASNQWYLSEYEGRLRIAHYDDLSDDRNKINRISVYEIDEENKKFNKVGYLDEGIGKPNQTIRSVLFEENIVNIVTYYQMDPLYKIELVDGITPVILSELEAPGYSEYLKSFELNGVKYLVGVGYTDGLILKVSLYLSEGNSNIQLGEDLIIESYDSELFENSMSLLFVKSVDNVIIGFPVDSYEYIIINLKPMSTNKITILHEFSGEDFVERVVCIDNYFYIMSNNSKEVKVYKYLDNELVECSSEE